MKISTFLTAAILFSGFFQLRAQPKPPQPKLIIGIVVEQMRYDYVFNYWDKFEEGGFKRLFSQGAVCQNANYSYLLSQPGVGHATIASGTTPSFHGIVGQNWYDRKSEKVINSVFDYNRLTAGSSSDEGKRSPRNLLVNTIGDELRLSNINRSKVLAVSVRDCGAIFSAGHNPNAAYWFDDRAGRWISGSYYMNALPPWVDKINQQEKARAALSRTWSTFLPLDEYTESLVDDSPYEIGFLKGMKTFPYDLAHINKRTREYSFFPKTPFANTYTKDFALKAIENENLGKDSYPDLLFINFSATDYIARLFGPASVEMQDLMLRLDRDIAHILNYIDGKIGKENVLVFLTSDRGSSYSPKFLKASKLPTGFFNHKAAISLLKAYLKGKFGLGKWVSHYENQQFYLNRKFIEESEFSYQQVLTEAQSLLKEFTGVRSVFSSSELEKEFLGKQAGQMQNSYHKERSGDLFISLLPGWTENIEDEIPPNSGFSYETHVPLVWYGWKIPQKELYRPVKISDIAPTLANFLRISYPNAATGTPIWDLLE